MDWDTGDYAEQTGRPYTQNFRTDKGKERERYSDSSLVSGTPRGMILAKNTPPYRRSIPPSLPSSTELKYFDMEVLFNDGSSGGRIIPANGGDAVIPILNEIPQGDDFNQRIGRSIVITSIKGYFYWRPMFATAPADSIHGGILRWFICVDKQHNGLSLSISDVLSTSTDSTLTLSHPNVNNRKRFEILKDKLCMFPQYTANYASLSFPPNIVQKFYKTCNIPVTFMDTGSLIVATNAIMMGATSNDTNQLIGTVRIRFTFTDV